MSKLVLFCSILLVGCTTGGPHLKGVMSYGADRYCQIADPAERAAALPSNVSVRC